MRKLDATVRQEIAARDDEWVKAARELVNGLQSQDKERQLRNIQSIAEGSNSWAALALFIRYQAARNELDKQWAEEAIRRLENLQRDAQSLAASRRADPKAVHMEIVSRVLGYAVRWHVWDVKGKEAG
ncbi:MAG TPA: hypothetical protein G4O02_11455 [Caldilineae bacterium]|nr:hypothetical protein [Caldilineae bacterium]